MKPIIRSLRRIPRWFVVTLFFVLIGIFLVKYIEGLDWDKLRSLDISWAMLGVATGIGLLFRYLGAYIWRVILRALGASSLPGFARTTDVYAQAWMGRYIPGTVTWIAGKVYLASSWGVSKSRLAVASVLEGGSQVLAITFVSFLLLGFDPRLDVLSAPAKGGLLLLGVVVLVVLIPRVFNTIMRQALALTGRHTVSDDLAINGSAVLRSFGLYVIGALTTGLSTYFVVRSIAPDIDVTYLWFIIGSSGLATVAGMAAPFAPSGIGIRDGLQLILLSAIMPKELALAATVLLRLWSVFVDVVFFGLARLVSYVAGKRGKNG